VHLFQCNQFQDLWSMWSMLFTHKRKGIELILNMMNCTTPVISML
jgi:hypothetical protein